MRSKLALSALVVASLFGATAIASAQTQPAPGASSSGNVGPGTTEMKPGTTSGGAMQNNNMQNNNMGTTSGNAMKKGPDASQQGAPTGASVGATGDSTEPGKVKEGATR